MTLLMKKDKIPRMVVKGDGKGRDDSCTGGQITARSRLWEKDSELDLMEYLVRLNTLRKN